MLLFFPLPHWVFVAARRRFVAEHGLSLVVVHGLLIAELELL